MIVDRLACGGINHVLTDFQLYMLLCALYCPVFRGFIVLLLQTGKGALASAKCGGGYDDGASWDSPVYNTGCEAFPVLNQSSSTTALKNISEVQC